jgi:hypothetical protein
MLVQQNSFNLTSEYSGIPKIQQVMRTVPRPQVLLFTPPKKVLPMEQADLRDMFKMAS